MSNADKIMARITADANRRAVAKRASLDQEAEWHRERMEERARQAKLNSTPVCGAASCEGCSMLSQPVEECREYVKHLEDLAEFSSPADYKCVGVEVQ